MTSGLDIAKATVKAATQNYVRNGTSYCQQFAGNYWETFFGRQTPNSYPNATAAYKASTITSKDWNTAPPGAYHYFEYGKDGHVGVALGSGMMASGTGWTDKAVQNLGKNVIVHKVADYAARLKYLGWSYTNGNRARITGLTDSFAPVLNPNQRQIGPVETRLRAEPTTTAPYNAKENLKPGTIITPQGWITGQKIDKIDIWYKTDKGYAWAGGFTNKTSDNLTDLNRSPVDDALDLLKAAKLDNAEATKRSTESSDKIEQAIKLIEGIQTK